ncbi:MAG: hypothetical protein EWM73_00307 [Nitrospira sp.]|nr:MAG: hypothetical protein EWM73_00307 [Nitrospira sp.]
MCPVLVMDVAGHDRFGDTREQDAEKVRQPVLFIWSVRSVWFVWLHETNQMDQADQITRQTGLVPDVRTIEVLV